MINNIKLIRARLVRHGIKGISNADIKEAILKHTDDSDDFTDEQKDAVVAELLKTHQGENTSTENVNIELSEGKESLEEIDHGMLASLPTKEITQSGKEAMVTRVARDLNVDISRDAIINIASQFDAGIKNTQEQRQALETAIIAYLDYQIAQEQQEQNQSIIRMAETFKGSVTALNKNIADFSNEVNTALEVSRDANKSAFDDLLKRFTIPSSKVEI